MLKVLSWVVIAPLAVFLIVFSVSNRTAITLDAWPLPYTAEIPVFAIVLVSLAAGVVWGGVAAWLAAGTARQCAREATRRAEIAERDVQQLGERISEFKAKAVRTGKAVAPAPRDVA